MQSVLSSSVQYLLAVSKFSSLYPALSKISLQIQGHRPPFFFLLFLNLFSPASSVQKHLKTFTVSRGSGHLLTSIRHLRKKPSVSTCLATVSCLDLGTCQMDYFLLCKNWTCDSAHFCKYLFRCWYRSKQSVLQLLWITLSVPWQKYLLILSKYWKLPQAMTSELINVSSCTKGMLLNFLAGVEKGLATQPKLRILTISKIQLLNNLLGVNQIIHAIKLIIKSKIELCEKIMMCNLFIQFQITQITHYFSLSWVYFVLM